MAQNQIKEELKDSEKKENVKTKTGKAGKMFRSIVDGSILTNDGVRKLLPFFIYITVIALVYIANNNLAGRKIREINKLKRDLKELRSEYITVKSNLMFLSKQSEIVKKLEPYGIKESVVPPVRLKVKKDTIN